MNGGVAAVGGVQKEGCEGAEAFEGGRGERGGTEGTLSDGVPDRGAEEGAMIGTAVKEKVGDDVWEGAGSR